MEKDPENKATETPTSGESQSSNEELPVSNDPESAAATPCPSVAVSEELMAKIVDLCEKNSEANIKLNDKLNNLSEKLGTIKEDVDRSKPLHIQAKVTGIYNFEQRQKEIVDDYELADKERARNLFKMVRNKYPNG